MNYKNFNIFDEFLMFFFDNIQNVCQNDFLTIRNLKYIIHILKSLDKGGLKSSLEFEKHEKTKSG